LLEIPVVLVVDAASAAGSIAAVVKGFSDLDPAIRVAGVICNRVAGARHYSYLEPAIRRHTNVIPLGWLPRRAEWVIPERHLGLTTVEDLASDRRWQELGEALSLTVDLDRLLALASVARKPSTCGETRATDAPRSPARRRVAVARDAAFCFYYPENLELLEAAGGAIVPFSPLADTVLPEGTDLLYLGGGYPELHAARLAANEPMRQSIRRFHADGGTIYAECGGLMAVGRELVDAAGQSFPMLDLLPARTILQKKLAALGYVRVKTTRLTPLGPAGAEARGHEFHYSRLEPLGHLTYAAESQPSYGSPRQDGLVAGNLWAAYAHIHFGSLPQIAGNLLRNGPCSRT
jgi:cobyrinic acid a,c-diamide synthase